jgi:hypothetical protein
LEDNAAPFSSLESITVILFAIYQSKEISACNVANLLLCKDNGRLSSVITDAEARNDVSLLVVWLFSELQFFGLLCALFSMGALTSRQHAGVEEVDIVSNHAYKYPPRSGMSNGYCRVE